MAAARGRYANIGLSGATQVYTANVSAALTEIERGVMYRVNATALNSGGPIGWRVSTTSRSATTFGFSATG